MWPLGNALAGKRCHGVYGLKGNREALGVELSLPSACFVVCVQCGIRFCNAARVQEHCVQGSVLRGTVDYKMSLLDRIPGCCIDYWIRKQERWLLGLAKFSIGSLPVDHGRLRSRRVIKERRGSEEHCWCSPFRRFKKYVSAIFGIHGRWRCKFRDSTGYLLSTCQQLRYARPLPPFVSGHGSNNKVRCCVDAQSHRCCCS